MATVQIVQDENITFEELSDTVLNKVLNDCRGSDCNDVVFDTYRKQSIKTVEQTKRGLQYGIIFSHMKPGHIIKNWKRILPSTESKAHCRKKTTRWRNLVM